eukprot:3073422-Amphidinium_carterae.2
MSSEHPPCIRHIPSWDASPVGAKLASAQTHRRCLSFSLNGANLRPRSIDDRKYCAICLNLWKATEGCLVTSLEARDAFHGMSGLLLNSTQFSEPASQFAVPS